MSRRCITIYNHRAVDGRAQFDTYASWKHSIELWYPEFYLVPSGDPHREKKVSAVAGTTQIGEFNLETNQGWVMS